MHYALSQPCVFILFLSDVVKQESINRSVEEVRELVQEIGLNCLINNARINVVADCYSGKYDG